MARVEHFINLMHTDPETLLGAPTDTQLIQENGGLARFEETGVPTAIRQGFLEMWLQGYVRSEVAALSPAEQEALRTTVRGELYHGEATETRTLDLRQILRYIPPSNLEEKK